MKKFFVAGLAFLFLLLLTTHSFGADEDLNAGISVGLGMPYGTIGWNIEINETDYFTFLLAFGEWSYKDNYSQTDEKDYCYDAGARFYLFNKKQILSPYVGFYYGEIPTEDKPDGSSKFIWGGSRGVGLELRVYSDEDAYFSINVERIDFLVDDTGFSHNRTYALGLKVATRH